jgi:predicted HAD superfamily Cof-like phosphohydrolase
MKKQLKQVEEFHNAFREINGVTPGLLPNKTAELRHKLMAEENDEYLEACFADDKVGIADALGDQLYILCGTILKHGFQDKIEEIFDSVLKTHYPTTRTSRKYGLDK